MTLTDIKREQANAAATLENIDVYVANATPAQLDTAAVWFLTEEAEGAFLQFQDCAIAMGLKTWNVSPATLASAYVKSAINNSRK